MDDQNQVLNESPVAPTDLGQIFSEQNSSAESQSATQQNHREQSDAASPDDTGSDAQRDNNWTFKAFESEKKKRQATAARLREVEEERDALLYEQSQKGEASPEETQYWLNPHETVREVEIRTNSRASRAEFISEYGKSTFEDLDRIVDDVMRKGHPDHAILSERMRASNDPVAVMAQWASETLGWSPTASQQNARPRVMPTNLAGARNVGKRIGPAWGGPSKLEDIFNRKRP
ncbi:hypothetical protein [Bradyrhizobium sp. G127]|uniref:hypothetical protein n=1 Tax=Bradyrhizobium sp. G127 TaxID=2904800 RepID=UPI001F27E5F4|nr:hypothetical protein [Bradyrhizobium sp. G127]MCF2523910.1 hypothetical protein [Bradyrhizobium sp. G127]